MWKAPFLPPHQEALAEGMGSGATGSATMGKAPFDHSRHGALAGFHLVKTRRLWCLAAFLTVLGLAINSALSSATPFSILGGLSSVKSFQEYSVPVVKARGKAIRFGPLACRPSDYRREGATALHEVIAKGEFVGWKSSVVGYWG